MAFLIDHVETAGDRDSVTRMMQVSSAPRATVVAATAHDALVVLGLGRRDVVAGGKRPFQATQQQRGHGDQVNTMA